MIGRDGAVPWHLPADLRHFKQLTTGHTVIMGRRTFESVGRPLPDRRNVIVTRDPTYRAAGAVVAPGLDEALALAADEPEVFVVGGAELYRLALPRADRMYLTIVHAEVPGDTYFPPFDPDEWHLEREERHTTDARHAHPFTFRCYVRRRRAER